MVIKKFSKKLVISAVMSVMLLFGASSSAYAYDGWADTFQTAYSLNGPINGVSTTINSSVDVDWYSYTVTGPVQLRVTLQSPAGLNYDFHIAVGAGTGLFPTASGWDAGKGGLDYTTITYNTALPITYYFQVRGQTGSDYSSTGQYVFTVVEL
ncbi:hypothetical protein ACX93W_06250 [Paenibacillus sp. CAU 1782]